MNSWLWSTTECSVLANQILFNELNFNQKKRQKINPGTAAVKAQLSSTIGQIILGESPQSRM
jgi:hypothetical protein